MTEDQPIHSPRRPLSCHPELVSGSITSATRRQGLKAQVVRQVSPSRIGFFDQVDLPLALPALDLHFAINGDVRRVKQLQVHKPLIRVALKKAAG